MRQRDVLKKTGGELIILFQSRKCRYQMAPDSEGAIIPIHCEHGLGRSINWRLARCLFDPGYLPFRRPAYVQRGKKKGKVGSWSGLIRQSAGIRDSTFIAVTIGDSV